jgi:hypothetical protein
MLVNTYALGIEFLRDADTGKLYLRCSKCGTWWDITDDLGKVYVADTVLAALQDAARHESTAVMTSLNGDLDQPYKTRKTA